MVVVGQFAGPHGVRGAFKIRSFTEAPADVASYGTLKTEAGKPLNIRIIREIKPALFLCEAAEINSPEDCDIFRAAKLYVPRSNLPAAEDDEFYLEDLIGLKAITVNGQDAGRVKAVVNYGAGDIVELFNVPGRKGSVLLPFTRDDVPEIDLTTGLITVVLPEQDDDDETAH